MKYKITKQKIKFHPPFILPELMIPPIEYVKIRVKVLQITNLTKMQLMQLLQERNILMQLQLRLQEISDLLKQPPIYLVQEELHTEKKKMQLTEENLPEDIQIAIQQAKILDQIQEILFPKKQQTSASLPQTKLDLLQLQHRLQMEQWIILEKKIKKSLGK